MAGRGSHFTRVRPKLFRRLFSKSQRIQSIAVRRVVSDCDCFAVVCRRLSSDRSSFLGGFHTRPGSRPGFRIGGRRSAQPADAGRSVKTVKRFAPRVTRSVMLKEDVSAGGERTVFGVARHDFCLSFESC